MKNSRASLTFIFITVVLDAMGIGIIIPIIPDLIMKLIGAGESEASLYGGWLMLSFAGMQFLFSPLMGVLSDKFGRRPVLLLAILGMGIDYIFHAFAPTIGWLFIGRLFAGITGASFTVANAYVADVSTREEKAKNFGMIGAAFGLGFIIGPAVGGLLGAHFSVEMPFYFAAALSLLNAAYGFFVLPESLAKEKRREIEWKNANPIGALYHLSKHKAVIGLIASLFFVHLAGQSLPATWTFFTKLKFNWSNAEVGYSLTVVGIMVALVQGGLTGIMVKKVGSRNTVFFGFLMWTSGMLMYVFVNSGWQLYAVLIPYCLGGMAGPTLQGLISNEVSDREQGELQGALTSLVSLSSVFGPLVMTFVFHYFTQENAPIYLPGAPYGLAAILMFIGFILASRTLLRKKEEVTP